MEQKNSAPHRDALPKANINVSIPQLEHDGPLLIAKADSLTSTQWHSSEVSLSWFYGRIAQVKQGAKGSTGGYVLGRLSGPRRFTDAVMVRSGVVFDMDYCHSVDAVWEAILTLRCSAVIHSTHNYTPEAPRCRVIIPTRRTMTPDEYVRVSHAVADSLGLDGLDASTHQAERMMFWPTCPEGAEHEHIFHYNDAPWLNPDEYKGSASSVVQHSTWRMGTDDADARTAELRRIAQGVGDGERNTAAARMAGYYFAHLDPYVALFSLENWNLANNPPLSLRELHTVARSIAQRQARKEAVRRG